MTLKYPVVLSGMPVKSYEFAWSKYPSWAFCAWTNAKVNAKLAVFTIFSALNATYDLYNSTERLTEEEIAEEVSNLLLKGLKA